MDIEKTHTFAIMAYGESRYLEKCIVSIQNQTEASEVFISSSTPSVFLDNIAEKYGLKLYINPEQRGIASDWQFAAEHCATPFYTLAHQDDIYYPDYTEKILALMQDSLIGFCNYEELVGEAVRTKTRMLSVKRLLLWPFYFKKSIKSKFIKKSVLKFGSPICCPSVMYNKALLGDFCFDEKYKNNLDWDAWLRLSQSDGRFSYRREILMAHRIHEDSETSRQIASSGRANEDRQMLSRMWGKKMTDVLCRMYKKSYDSNNIRKNG